MDDACRAGAVRSAAVPRAPILGGSGAYVVYTSGSSGIPKGVVVTHQALVNHALSVAETFALTENDRVLQFSAPGFDVAAEELYASFAKGSTVVLRTAETVASLPDFEAYVGRHALTVLNLPASLWHLWVHHLAQGRERLPSSLRAVIVGSEVVSARSWEAWRQIAGPRVRLWNAYGLSETTITSTLYGGSEALEGAVPIGRPIANVAAYVLDPYMEPVPLGAPGELYIGGAAPARGYLHRSALTAESFVPDPFAGTPGARMMRTGDRARYLPGGNLQYLGRADLQVKLRGYRVDVGEIEAVLARHPAVREIAVVAVGEVGSDSVALAAYVVANPTERSVASELRRLAQTKLPSYMIPSRYVLVDSLPLTTGMKVNRRALAAMAADTTGPADAYVAPKIPLQQLMAQIWADVLGADRVGIEDNFFDLGGHSLAAIRLVSRLSEALQVRIEIRSIFEYPTIVTLAQEVERRLAAPPSGEIALRHAALTSAPLAKDQEQVWFLNQRMPDRAFFNMMEILHLQGMLDAGALRGALTEIVRRHEALRTTFPVLDGKPFQQVHAPAAFSLSVVERHDLPGEEEENETAALASAEADRPFDLTREPPFRVTLLSLRPDLNVLIITMHHIMCDGWSLDTLMRELGELYRAFVEGRPSPLEELPIQYSDFAAWQQRWLNSAGKDRQVAYWQQKLANLPVLPFPGRQRGVGSSFRYSRVSTRLTSSATRELKAATRREDATLFMMLLTALDVLLHVHTGSQDIPVAVQYANRNRAETEQVIGLFTNTLVLRCSLSWNPTFRDVLRRVRREALEAFSHQDLPFDMLAAAILREKGVRLEPQVMLLFDDVSAPPSRLHDLAVARVQRQKKKQDVDVVPTMFDLVVQAEIEPDGLAVTFLYDRNIFEPATAETMVGTCGSLLSDVSSCLPRTIGDLSASFR
jgi:amino acid adenylation domain-containing protein